MAQHGEPTQPVKRRRRLLIPGMAQSERGQALVEFALILPVFMLLLFSMVDFGRAFYAWQVVTNGAREGARVGAAGGNDAAITTRVNQATNSLSGAKTITTSNVQGPRGTPVVVQVNYAFVYVTPIGTLVSQFGGSLSSITISSSASMRLE